VARALHRRCPVLDGGAQHSVSAIEQSHHVLDPERRQESELAIEDEMAILDETKVTLVVASRAWIRAWPGRRILPSRTRHIISNIEVEPGDTASELKVYSNFLVYRTRAETEQDFYVGAEDLLRRVDGAWKIARRKLVLDQNVLLPKNVSVFF